MKKVYAQGWCYWICGKTNVDIVGLMTTAKEFVEEINVPIETVVYDGVIHHSSWCKGYQQFGAPCKNPPSNYKPISGSIWEYIKTN